MDLHDDCHGACPAKLAKINGEELPPCRKGIFSFYQRDDSQENVDARKLLEDEFRYLSRSVLLQHCMLGVTQNINEGLHSKEHTMASKTKFLGMKRFLFSTKNLIFEAIACSLECKR